jgi:hypothetical protein
MKPKVFRAKAAIAAFACFACISVSSGNNSSNAFALARSRPLLLASREMVCPHPLARAYFEIHTYKS